MNILLLKNIGKDFSDLKILITTGSSSLNHENSAKVPISKTNFSNKVPISKSYRKVSSYLNV